MVLGVFSISFDASADGGRAVRGMVLPRFIGGEENLLVRTACQDSLSPEPRFTPLVFIGPSGTGKSLLARGLLEAATSNGASAAGSSATTGADFARGYANAVQTDSLDDFRIRYEAHHRLLIDDLHGLAGKDQAQHELCRLIDSMAHSNRVLLGTMPTLPAEASGLSSALVSRLSGGLTVPVQPPGAEARHEIVRQLAKLYRLELCDETRRVLCEGEPAPFATAVELQHALSQLMLLSEQQQRTIDVDLARQLLDQTIRQEPTLRSICQLTSRHYQLKASELRGPSRRQSIALARSMAMLLCRRLTGASLGAIGQHFGNRDHTTVIHACRQTERRIESDPAVKADFNTLLQQLNA